MTPVLGHRRWSGISIIVCSFEAELNEPARPGGVGPEARPVSVTDRDATRAGRRRVSAVWSERRGEAAGILPVQQRRGSCRG